MDGAETIKARQGRYQRIVAVVAQVAAVMLPVLAIAYVLDVHRYFDVDIYGGEYYCVFLSLFLMQNYIPESEVNIVYMKPTDLAQALINGEIDAISMRDPYTKYAKDVLADKAVEFSALGLYRKTFNLVAKKYFIDDRPEAIKKILQGILKAREYIQKNRKESVEIIARSLKMDRESVDSVWDDYNFSISLDQSLLVSLEDEARWAIEQGFTEKTKVPNYLDFIYYDGLEAVEPYAVTIIH